MRQDGLKRLNRVLVPQTAAQGRVPVYDALPGPLECVYVEIAFDMPRTHPLIPDILYLNAYLGIERYRSAFRNPDVPTPLARVGITFAGRGLGRYGTVLGDQLTDQLRPRSVSGAGHALVFADRSAGFALGYQMFLFGDVRKQLIVEVAGPCVVSLVDTHVD